MAENSWVQERDSLLTQLRHAEENNASLQQDLETATLCLQVWAGNLTIMFGLQGAYRTSPSPYTFWYLIYLMLLSPTQFTQQATQVENDAAAVRVSTMDAQLHQLHHDCAIMRDERTAANLAIDSLHEGMTFLFRPHLLFRTSEIAVSNAILDAAVLAAPFAVRVTPLSTSISELHQQSLLYTGCGTKGDVRMQLSHVQAQLAASARDSEILTEQHRREIDSKNGIIAELAEHVHTTAAPLEELEATQIKMRHLTEQLDNERRTNVTLQHQIEQMKYAATPLLTAADLHNHALLASELQADRDLHADHCLRLGAFTPPFHRYSHFSAF